MSHLPLYFLVQGGFNHEDFELIELGNTKILHYLFLFTKNKYNVEKDDVGTEGKWSLHCVLFTKSNYIEKDDVGTERKWSLNCVMNCFFSVLIFVLSV